MSVNGQAVDTDSIRPGKEPVFTETNKMVYVGISEFFFNGAAMAIYKSGQLEFNVPEVRKADEHLVEPFCSLTFFKASGM